MKDEFGAKFKKNLKRTNFVVMYFGLDDELYKRLRNGWGISIINVNKMTK